MELLRIFAEADDLAIIIGGNSYTSKDFKLMLLTYKLRPTNNIFEIFHIENKVIFTVLIA